MKNWKNYSRGILSEYKFSNLHSLTDWRLVGSSFYWRRHDVSGQRLFTV